LAPRASVQKAYYGNQASRPQSDPSRRQDDDQDVIDTTWRVVEE
jgi:hypothetical protein